jgi:hypothetical protein
MYDYIPMLFYCLLVINFYKKYKILLRFDIKFSNLSIHFLKTENILQLFLILSLRKNPAFYIFIQLHFMIQINLRPNFLISRNFQNGTKFQILHIPDFHFRIILLQLTIKHKCILLVLDFTGQKTLQILFQTLLEVFLIFQFLHFIILEEFIILLFGVWVFSYFHLV